MILVPLIVFYCVAVYDSTSLQSAMAIGYNRTSIRYVNQSHITEYNSCI